MKPIIIVGGGYAAKLHLEAYIRKLGVNLLPTIIIINEGYLDPQIGDILKKFHPRIISLDFDNVDIALKELALVDICTPTETHVQIIKRFSEMGFINFVVEKPLVSNLEDYEKILESGVRVNVIHNYLYSKLTKRIHEVIDSLPLASIFMKSTFCKDRSADTLRGRGFNSTYAPHIFSLELYHQMYIADYLLGPSSVLYAKAYDMCLNNALFESHGGGIIALEHKFKNEDIQGRQKKSLHISNMLSNERVRRILIFQNDMVIQGDYPLSQSDLCSSIKLFSSGEQQSIELLPEDDMLGTNLENAYSWIENDEFNCFNMLPSIGKYVELFDKAINMASHNHDDSQELHQSLEDCQKLNKLCIMCKDHYSNIFDDNISSHLTVR